MFLVYTVDKFEIFGFWNRLDVACSFSEGANIIIGRNGSGKTTFMNILHSILTVDVGGLADNEFQSAIVTLVNGKKKKTVKVTKLENDDYSYPKVEYQISQKKSELRLLTIDERVSPMLRRRILDASENVRRELDSIVAVSSISVYRLRHDDEYEVRDRRGARVLSPVDYRLDQALHGLTDFQLELAVQEQAVASGLQKDVLGSILFSEEDASESRWEISFDKEEEQRKLLTAYTQLGAVDSGIRKKIRFHIAAIDQSISEIKSNEKVSKELVQFDIKPLEALRKTRKIIELSLEAKEKTQVIYAQRDLFLKTVKEFITDKNFEFFAGKLIISNEFGEIDHSKLSSGEKQLIILLIEALLQNNRKHVFLADEPELSLHIAWQRNIIPAITKLNPYAQVIVATHSPEIAAKYRGSIFDMEELING
jgi:ABC-type lipoprotein export system ATPase subunit